MRKFIIFLLVIFHLSLLCFSKRYTYFNYQDALDLIQQLSENYPRYVKLFDAKKENEYIFDTPCGASSCEHWYLQITDFNQPSERIKTLPQVFLLAGIHGDEVIGVNTLLYLAEHLMRKNGADEHITELIKTRMLILLPLANPSGFYYGQRGEKNGSRSIDPNRDFPYNLPDNNCLVTASARVINHIFKKYLIQSTITFHGGERSITYPWGAFNHVTMRGGTYKADESPDDSAFIDVAKVLTREAGSNPLLMINPYPTGRMTDIVYAVNGGLEDWSYGASWETQFSSNVVNQCEGLPASETTYNTFSLRTLIYLVEASFPKRPEEAYLGATEGLEPYGDRMAYGHIPMNIKMSLAFLDLVEPYVRMKPLIYSEEEQKLTIRWQGGGCKSVDYTRLKYGNTVEGAEFEKELSTQSGPGYYENNNFVFEEVIDLKDIDFNLNLFIELTCDQRWIRQINPKPKTSPVTHFVQARTNQDYFVETEEYSISGKQIINYNLTGITKDYLLKAKPINPRSIVLMMEIVETSTFEKVGTITSQITSEKKTLALQYDGKLNIQNLGLEGHLYQFGDISYGKNTIGDTMNNITFQNDSNAQSSLLFTLNKSATDTLSIDYKAPIIQEADIFKYIGRSVLLTSNDNPDKQYVGQINVFQPDSCTKDKQMNGCLGFDLESRDGVCLIKTIPESNIKDFKLFIDSSDKNNVKISGFIPDFFIQQNENFEEIYIVNENIKQNFTINKEAVEGVGIINQGIFPLHSAVALGNILRVYREKSGDMILLGDCTISLRNPNLIESQFYQENYRIESQYNIPRIILVIVLGLLFVVMGIFVVRILRMQRMLKEEERRGNIGTESSGSREPQGRKRHVELVESDEPEHEI